MDYITGTGRADTQRDLGGQYNTGTFEDIVAMAMAEQFAQPCRNPKDHHWAVFVNYNGPEARSSIQLRGMTHVKNTCFWLDFDEGDPTFEQVQQFGEAVAGGHEFLIYTTRSNGEVREDGTTKKKYRFLLPHSQFVDTVQYKAFAMVLCQTAESWALTPDYSVATATQLCYLPSAGPEYRFHHQRGPRVTPDSLPWLNQLAISYYQENKLGEVTPYDGSKDETARSPVAAFCRKHNAADMLLTYGFETYNGVDFHHPTQSTKSYATKVDDNGRGWVTASETVRLLTGRKNGDGFDIYVALQCGGNREQALRYAAQCLAEEDKAKYGCATAEHGRQLWAGHLAWLEEQKQIELDMRKAEAAEAERQLNAAAEAAEHNWSGAWLSELPSNIRVKPNALEWAAWHAPGIIGQVVRAKAPNLKRHSLVPALLGAIAGVAYICQGKFVSEWNKFITPSAILVYLVGDTGSGKSDAMSTFYDIVHMADSLSIRARRIGHLGSGPAVIDYMSGGEDGNTKNPHVFILQNEGGAKRAAGKGDKHQEGVVAEMTDLHTAFEDGVEGSHTKTNGSTGFLDHPTLGGLFTSTPRKLFDTIAAADAESGWLGRNAFIGLRSTEPNADRMDPHYNADTVQAVKALASVLMPLPGNNGDSVWEGRNGERFHLRQYTEETQAYLLSTLFEYDAKARDHRREAKERALFDRALEMVNRLTFIAGLGSGEGPVPMNCATWARLIVDESCAYTTQNMQSVPDYENMSPGAKVRHKIIEMFTHYDDDTKKYFGKYQNVNADKEIELGKSRLKRRLMDNTPFATSVIAGELEAMIAAEKLIEVQNVGSKIVYLRYIKY